MPEPARHAGEPLARLCEHPVDMGVLEGDARWNPPFGRVGPNARPVGRSSPAPSGPYGLNGCTAVLEMATRF
jgi:hypothetical protein